MEFSRWFNNSLFICKYEYLFVICTRIMILKRFLICIYLYKIILHFINNNDVIINNIVTKYINLYLYRCVGTQNVEVSLL